MSRMTSKGQVTIPKRIRDYLGLKPGAEVEFTIGAEGKVGLAVEKRVTSRFAALRGTLGPGMSADELMKLTRGWGEPDREGR
ncbi:MAG TPA: AbrB/MazE/SpoVT family DNA-binding domain-containing protein [Stellaceae bacterium]|nr:AbrB/MazE/SpoVT family DNA-binding domain-containing protein [Stellaceae bacterium]